MLVRVVIHIPSGLLMTGRPYSSVHLSSDTTSRIERYSIMALAPMRRLSSGRIASMGRLPRWDRALAHIAGVHVLLIVLCYSPAEGCP